MKDDIREFCSTSVVEAMIEEKIAAQPPSSKSVGNVANAEQPPKRRESRTKLFQEMINRIVQLEETGSVLNEELENIKSALDLKSDKQDQDFIDQLRNEIALLAKEIEKLQVGEKEVDAIKQRLDDISEESNNVKISSEYNSKEQGSIIKNVAQVEKQLESLTDTVFTKLGKSYFYNFFALLHSLSATSLSLPSLLSSPLHFPLNECLLDLPLFSSCHHLS